MYRSSSNLNKRSHRETNWANQALPKIDKVGSPSVPLTDRQTDKQKDRQKAFPQTETKLAYQALPQTDRHRQIDRQRYHPQTDKVSSPDVSTNRQTERHSKLTKRSHRQADKLDDF